jgi:AraC family transcriptional regulator
LQRALAVLRRAEEPNLATVALACGYADQAHFTREFVRITGMTPKTYLSAAPLHTNHVPLARDVF